MHQSEEAPGQLDEGFSRPVESIMRCEDFKSNFARRLSNRYSSRSAVVTKRQNSVKLRPPRQEAVDDVSATSPLLFWRCLFIFISTIVLKKVKVFSMIFRAQTLFFIGVLYRKLILHFLHIYLRCVFVYNQRGCGCCWQLLLLLFSLLYLH